MKIETPNQIGHGNRAYGIGYSGPAALSTLAHQKYELERLMKQRHPSIETPALEGEIASLSMVIANREGGAK